jgi:ABC-type multidrug transport system fused ATPase/permease subunit
MFRRFLPLLRPYSGRLVLAFAATLAQPVLSAVRIWLLKVLIDSVVVPHQTELLFGVCGAYLATGVGKGLASFADDYLGGWVGGRVVRDLRTQLYDHLQGLSLRFYHGQRLTDVAAQSLTIVVFLCMLFYLDPSLALVSLAVLPAVAATSVNYARRTRSAQVDVRDWASALTSVAEESLSAVALVKAFAREPFERARFDETTQGGLGARMRSVRLRALFTPAIDLLATIGTVMVVWFGVQAVWSGHLSLGGLVVFLGYLGSLYVPIQALSRLTGVVQRARVGTERVAEVLDAPLAVQERRGNRGMGPVRGVVEFREVRFGYTSAHQVLRGVDLILQPGEIVGLVGASGAGKTTLVSLLLNYYDADSGVVAIDGHNVREFDPRSVRERIAAVLQEPMLFNTTVRDNLRYGRLDASDAEIEAAARAVQAHEFICDLSDGYRTNVGPRGARLSGGQRQRLAIARALLRGAPILVLDEATSALDLITEAAVLEAMRERTADSSVLLVAHRLSTIRHADRILVLQEGRVIEEGTHAQLVGRQGAYWRLVAAQCEETLGRPSPPLQGTLRG